jgi:phosphate/sulfate permease
MVEVLMAVRIKLSYGLLTREARIVQNVGTNLLPLSTLHMPSALIMKAATDIDMAKMQQDRPT